MLEAVYRLIAHSFDLVRATCVAVDLVYEIVHLPLCFISGVLLGFALIDGLPFSVSTLAFVACVLFFAK